jgi:Icc-related predicted phosphoesterase
MADKWLVGTPEGYQKIVMAHIPPATIEKWAYHAKDPAGSKMFTDLMAKHRVDEVFLGHIHAYSTAILDGVSYTIAGGGGAELHKNFGPSGSVHHYIICDVTPEGIVQQVVRFHRKEGSASGKSAGSKMGKKSGSDS